ncbi:MAG: beta-lactamase family protein [Acidobacteria bacterium]|nr:beta-lactamase family protein [Acidobacteriota bacterium]
MRRSGWATAFALTFAVLRAEVPPAKGEALARIVEEAMQKTRIPAVSVAVSLGDGPVWASAWGFADLENRVHATPDSVFRIGSISKPFTGVAALQLREAGRLDLEAEIQQYVPSFPKKKWPINIRLLLCHQAGIRNYMGGEFDSTRNYPNVVEALQIFARDPLLHEPGTKYAYTTYGINLAGAAVESAGGRPFAEQVKTRILDPAGLTSTQPDDVYRLIPRRAHGYRKRKDGTLENCALADTSNKLPGGGWVSTASDLVLFARALLDGTLLKPQSLDMMWAPQKLSTGETTGYGLCWGLYRQEGLLVAEHGGTQQGIKSHLLVVPEKKLIVAVLTNLEESGAADIARALLAELWKASPQ